MTETATRKQQFKPITEGPKIMNDDFRAAKGIIYGVIAGAAAWGLLLMVGLLLYLIFE